MCVVVFGGCRAAFIVYGVLVVEQQVHVYNFTESLGSSEVKFITDAGVVGRLGFAFVDARTYCRFGQGHACPTYGWVCMLLLGDGERVTVCIGIDDVEGLRIFLQL